MVEVNQDSWFVVRVIRSDAILCGPFDSREDARIYAGEVNRFLGPSAPQAVTTQLTRPEELLLVLLRQVPEHLVP